MRYISHRGNLIGSFPYRENAPDYIEIAIKKGFNIEIDVRYIDGKIYLGHDEPTYEVDLDFLLKKELWCHAKNLEALEFMIESNVHCFWHQTDDVTLTSKGYLWTYPGKQLTKKSIYCCPEMIKTNVAPFEIEEKCFGICSDFILYYRDCGKLINQ